MHREGVGGGVEVGGGGGDGGERAAGHGLLLARLVGAPAWSRDVNYSGD